MTRASNTPSVVRLAWLLACLDRAVEALDEIGCDVDARVVEAHRAELAAGRQWPGQSVTSLEIEDYLTQEEVGYGL